MIRVLIADDHNLVRNGIRLILSEQSNIQVVGEADDGDKAISMAKELKPDVVLMDINLPGTNGIVATSLIKKSCPDIRVIGLSMHNDPEYVRMMIKNGAYGYVLKSSSPDELFMAINEVRNDRKYICKDMTEKMLNSYLRLEMEEDKEGLNSKERMIVKYICEGKSSKEIASLLNHTPKSIEIYRSELMKKIAARSISDVVIYGIRNKIIDIE